MAENELHECDVESARSMGTHSGHLGYEHGCTPVLATLLKERREEEERSGFATTCHRRMHSQQHWPPSMLDWTATCKAICLGSTIDRRSEEVTSVREGPVREPTLSLAPEYAGWICVTCVGLDRRLEDS